MKDDRELQEYLAKIRKTIAESERVVSQAELRIAETDRMLESQGLTRAQVMGFKFTPEQRDMVNRELVRRGMEPLEEEPEEFRAPVEHERLGGESWNVERGDAELAERQRKFGMMMKPFQI